MTTKDVAQKLSVSEKTVRAFITMGVIKAEKVKGKWVISPPILRSL